MKTLLMLLFLSVNSTAGQLSSIYPVPPLYLFHANEGTGLYAYSAINNDISILNGYGSGVTWTQGLYGSGVYAPPNVQTQWKTKQTFYPAMSLATGIWVHFWLKLGSCPNLYSTDIWYSDTSNNVPWIGIGWYHSATNFTFQENNGNSLVSAPAPACNNTWTAYDFIRGGTTPGAWDYYINAKLVGHYSTGYSLTKTSFNNFIIGTPVFSNNGPAITSDEQALFVLPSNQLPFSGAYVKRLYVNGLGRYSNAR